MFQEDKPNTEHRSKVMSAIFHRSLEKLYTTAIRGEGVYLYTDRGDKILDGCCARQSPGNVTSTKRLVSRKHLRRLGCGKQHYQERTLRTHPELRVPSCQPLSHDVDGVGVTESEYEDRLMAEFKAIINTLGPKTVAVVIAELVNGTFQGHSMECAGALTVQKILDRDNLILDVMKRGLLLESFLPGGLLSYMKEYGVSLRGSRLFRTVDHGRLALICTEASLIRTNSSSMGSSSFGSDVPSAVGV
ncbi:aminotransferase class-III [Histoplasma capsulatum G186AR]|uniref:Aminotransferase class-III n=1 Tax=Ajellomyces capsulatus (strain G186AR / H82 / ATCC MYA-2454 / RMSCC 2432) TaxID=447093 RepID=C0NXU4_AJECG|nr:aminotransferase class-III [Histoplasma capsulatum G186AR]EEH03612.1 aminotransferase class-III [Histoplasma capsulatum G186AR]